MDTPRPCGVCYSAFDETIMVRMKQPYSYPRLSDSKTPRLIFLKKP